MFPIKSPALAIVLLAALAAASSGAPTRVAKPGPAEVAKIVKSDAEWKKLLPAQTYHVMREKGTEIAFTGKYWNNHKTGGYRCASCDLELFTSAQKYESGTGWPSFWKAPWANHVRVGADPGGDREEVTCARCGGHLGHVFDDGPAPTGLRYCMNSAALKFIASK